MATATTTKIEHLFVPELATTYTALEATDKNAFFMSGVAYSDPEVTPLMDATGGGQLISMPYFNPIDDTEANIGNDDNTQKSTPEGITAAYETAVKTFQNKSYSVMDLAKLAAGANPQVAINNGLNNYWIGQAEDRIIAAAKGILADSVANHDSDLLYDVTAATETNLTAIAMNNAAAYLGEYLDDIKVVCVHPTVFNNLRNQDFVNVKVPSETRTLYSSYGDYMIIIDKNMPVEVGEDSKPVFYSFMFGANAFVFNYGNPGVEYEIDRDPASGNGAGEDLLYTRRCDLILPHGYQTAAAKKTGLNQAALASANTWTRVWDKRELIKFVAVKSLG